MKDTFLFHLAGLSVCALPFTAIGSMLTPAPHDGCTVVEVIDTATLADWQDAESQAAADARANGCAVIKMLRG